MSLLDSNIQNFEIKTGFGEFGTYSLLGDNDSVLLTCKKKFTFRGLTFEIKDSTKKRIGLVKKQGQTKFSTEIWIEDNDGIEIYRSEVPLGPNIIEEIYDNEGQIIGNFSTVKRKGFDPTNTPMGWTLTVSSPSVNRRQIWGLFLSILNAFRPINWFEPGGAMGG